MILLNPTGALSIFITNKNNMVDKHFFRTEAIQNKLAQVYGSVSINLPPSYFIVTIGLVVIVFFIIIFLLFAEFSERFIVAGYVNSSQAAVQVYPRTDGIIIKRYHQIGDKVKKGDRLFLVDTSYAGYQYESREIGQQIRQRESFINEALVYKKKQLQALKPLFKKKYISQEEYNAKKDEINALESSKILAEMDFIKYQQSRAYLIRAPISGLIASDPFKKGQYAHISKPLVKIIPVDAELIAELFVPAKQAGFLSKNNKIMIRYDAYPYERFGVYKAVVQNISQSIITDEEEEKPLKIGEPYYKVTARLEKQHVLIYGREKNIRHGMTLSAIIVGTKRKIWQWIFDPLYSVYGVLLV
jgi:membrane fusion protein